MKPPKKPAQTLQEPTTADIGVAHCKRVHTKGLESFPSVPPVEDTIKPRQPMNELPMNTIDEAEGVSLCLAAHKRGSARTFRTYLLDMITDSVTPRTYPADCDPDHPGRRRLHPLFVSAGVCFGVLFAVTVYFSFSR